MPNSKTEEVLKILKYYAKKTENVIENKNENNIKLAKIKPILNEIKEGAELIVTGAELFGVITGLFNFPYFVYKIFFGFTIFVFY